MKHLKRLSLATCIMLLVFGLSGMASATPINIITNMILQSIIVKILQRSAMKFIIMGFLTRYQNLHKEPVQLVLHSE